MYVIHAIATPPVSHLTETNNAQINYGTGRDVNSESIKDAEIPLKITFTGNSSISLPIWNSVKE